MDDTTKNSNNKKSVSAEIIMSIKTKETAFSLFMKEKDYCKKKQYLCNSKEYYNGIYE